MPRSSNEKMPVCPVTVKQTVLPPVHPLAGPAVVSPDITVVARDIPAVKCIRSLPTLASRKRDQQAPANRAGTFGAKEGPISPEIQLLAPRSVLKPKGGHGGLPPALPSMPSGSSGMRLNKFVRRLHDMLQAEKDSGIVEWRRGLLVLHSTDAFAKTILPKYFNTRNFKTFRRQLNYYGFVHVRSFSTTGSTTTALWVNRDLAKHGSAEISSVLMLKRVEPCESAKTAEGRRVRKELAIFTVEEDIGVSPKSLQMEQIRSLALRAGVDDIIHDPALLPRPLPSTAPGWIPPTEVPCSTLPPAPAVSAPFFPKLSSKAARQVSPTGEQSKSLFIQTVADEQVSAQIKAAPKVPIPDVEDSERDVGAANLLLMLSKSASATKVATEEDVRSAICPGQFLM